MNAEWIEQKQLVYELMNGTWDLNVFPVSESAYVQDEWEKGKPCEILYQQAYEAAQRICQRLQEEEDEDIYTIFHAMLRITEYFSLQMYDYGVFFSKTEQK